MYSKEKLFNFSDLEWAMKTHNNFESKQKKKVINELQQKKTLKSTKWS